MKQKMHTSLSENGTGDLIIFMNNWLFWKYLPSFFFFFLVTSNLDLKVQVKDKEDGSDQPQGAFGLIML